MVIITKCFCNYVVMNMKHILTLKQNKLKNTQDNMEILLIKLTEERDKMRVIFE